MALPSIKFSRSFRKSTIIQAFGHPQFGSRGIMTNPTVINIHSFFYPIGNTPAVFSTQGLPPEQKANILLLGCGDVRNVLFTIYSAGKVQLDFTCCDIEKSIIARNILLFTFLLDDRDGVRNENIWSIYYHLFLDKKAEILLDNQARKLHQISDSLQTWHRSQYGKLLRICDKDTLREVRSVWSTYTLSNLNEAEKSRRTSRFRSDIQKAKDFRNIYVGKKRVITGFRSAAPLSLYAINDLADLNKHYWEHGSINRDDDAYSTSKAPNPTFASQPTDSFTIHYGTDPLLGFHLAPAYAPLNSDDPTASHSLQSSPANKTVEVAQQQFRTWGNAFRRAASGGLVLRFCVSEALAFCYALQHHRKPQESPTNLYRNPSSFELLALDGEDYQPNRTAPLTFEVIDTSNLGDHVGLINLLVAASPLLDGRIAATLYTESLAKRKRNHEAQADAMLRGNLRTMSIVLGLFPSEYWANITAAASAEEVIWGSVNISMNVTDDAKRQVYSRLSWKRSIACPKDGSRTQIQPLVRFHDNDLVLILFNIYLNMFQGEDIRGLFFGLDSLEAHKNFCPRYHRGSFALLVRYVKSKVAANWDQVLDRLLHMIERDNIRGRNGIQELYLYLHLLRLYSVPHLLSSPRAAPGSGIHHGLAAWDGIPPVVCVTVKVPRENLKIFTGIPETELGTPVVHCALQSSAESSRQWHNFFAAIQLAFGEVTTSGEIHSSDFRVNVSEDIYGWKGNSPLLVSFYAPSWVLLQEPRNATVSFGIQNAPSYTQKFVKKLGTDMFVYKTTLGNEENVFVTKDFPNQANNAPFCTVAPADVSPSTSVDDHFETSLIASLNPNKAEIEELVGRIDLVSEKAKAILRDQAKVRAVQTSPCSIDVIIGTSGLHHELRYPVPVIQQQSRIRVARKSSFVEIMAPVANPAGCSRLPALTYPVILTKSSPVLWNMPRVNLDNMPALDIKRSERMQWLIRHCSLMFSARERKLREMSTPPDVRVRFKDSLFAILMHYSGLQGQKARIFGLDNPTEGGIQAIIFPSCLRLDTTNRTVVLDAAMLVLTHSMMPKIHAYLEELVTVGVCTIKVDNEEMQLWKQTIPAFAERCRQWSHGAQCEYQVEARVPLSTKYGQAPLCSCGQGKMPAGFVKGVPGWETFSRYVTRVAISPSFASLFVDMPFGG